MSAPNTPYAFAAERAVLGGVFRDPAAIDRVADWLQPEHFGTQAHAWVYEAMLEANAAQRPPDRITVASILSRDERLGQIGGELELIELMREVPTAALIENHASDVERTAILRRLIQAGGDIAAVGYEQPMDLEDAILRAETALSNAISGRARSEGAVKIGAVLNGLYERLGERRDGDGMIGLSTGYPDIDALTGGLQKSDLIILAARPSVGKTALALSLAYNVGLRIVDRDDRDRPIVHPGATVGVFSLEMSADQLTQRMLSMHTGIELQRLRTSQLRGDELDAAIAGMGHLSEAPIFIDDTPGLTIRNLARRARRMHVVTGGLQMVIVDYLQLMSSERQGRGDANRVQEVSEISRGLKSLARELNTPVLALSQLSRAVEGRQSKVPMLSDLRESGSIEQDADIVMFIYRDELYDKDTDKKGIAEIHIAKHRNGPTGVVPLRFEGRTTRFEHLSRYTAPEGY